MLTDLVQTIVDDGGYPGADEAHCFLDGFAARWDAQARELDAAARRLERYAPCGRSADELLAGYPFVLVQARPGTAAGTRAGDHLRWGAVRDALRYGARLS